MVAFHDLDAAVAGGKGVAILGDPGRSDDDAFGGVLVFHGAGQCANHIDADRVARAFGLDDTQPAEDWRLAQRGEFALQAGDRVERGQHERFELSARRGRVQQQWAATFTPDEVPTSLLQTVIRRTAAVKCRFLQGFVTRGSAPRHACLSRSPGGLQSNAPKLLRELSCRASTERPWEGGQPVTEGKLLFTGIEHDPGPEAVAERVRHLMQAAEVLGADGLGGLDLDAGCGADRGLKHRVHRTGSGEQQFDLDRGVAGGHLAVEGCQRGVASLGKGCQVVIGPQLVALVITRGDRTPDRVQSGWLVSP